MGGVAIEAKGLVKFFDAKQAVGGIDLAVPTGSIYGILGPNGAGSAPVGQASRHAVQLPQWTRCGTLGCSSRSV